LLKISTQREFEAIPVSAETSETHEHLYTERLNSLTLNYSYTTELFDDPAKNYGYAWGTAAFKASSVQNWELVDSAPGYTPGKHESYSDIDIFNVGTTRGSLVQFGQYTYQKDGSNYYVSTGLVRFTFSKKTSVQMLSSLVSSKISRTSFRLAMKLRRSSSDQERA